MFGNVFFHGIHDHFAEHSLDFVRFLQTAQHGHTEGKRQIAFSHQIFQQDTLSGIEFCDLCHIRQMQFDQALLRIRLSRHGCDGKCQFFTVTVGR